MRLLYVSNSGGDDSIGRMLTCCNYHVETTTQALAASEMLQDGESKFDLVIIDMDVHGMDGLKLLTDVVRSMGIPVIAISSSTIKELILKGYEYGVCELLSKPVSIEELRNIWQHAMIRRRNNLDPGKLDCGVSSGEVAQEFNVNVYYTKTPYRNVHHTRRPYRKRKDCGNKSNKSEHGLNRDNEGTLVQKNQRVVWTIDLHHKFVAAVDKLGLEKAVPKKILELMGVKNLSRENVASHLQKYRLSLKKSRDRTKKSISVVDVVPTYDMQSLGYVDSTFYGAPLREVEDKLSIVGGGYISHSTMSESPETTEELQVENTTQIIDDMNSNLEPGNQDYVDIAKSLEYCIDHNEYDTHGSNFYDMSLNECGKVDIVRSLESRIYHNEYDTQVGEEYSGPNFSDFGLNEFGNFPQITQGHQIPTESPAVNFSSACLIDGSHFYPQKYVFNDMYGNANHLASDRGDYPSNIGSASAFPFCGGASENFDFETKLSNGQIHHAEVTPRPGFVDHIQATHPILQAQNTDEAQNPHGVFHL